MFCFDRNRWQYSISFAVYFASDYGVGLGRGGRGGGGGGGDGREGGVGEGRGGAEIVLIFRLRV